MRKKEGEIRWEVSRNKAQEKQDTRYKTQDAVTRRKKEAK